MASDSYSIGSEDPTQRKQGGLSSLFHRTKDRLPELSSFPHTIRQGAVLLNPNQLAETRNLQLAIKAYSGVVHDYQALSREGQVFSKALFTWSKEDKGADIVDVCDRLSFLQFKTAELQLEAAGKLEQSRAILKDIRNFENDLVPRRRNAASTAAKIASLQKEQKKTAKVEEQIGKLTAELAQLEAENATFEASFDTLKRQKLHEFATLQFAAQKELGEKLAIVSGYGDLLLQGMETDGVGEQYKGHQRTARVKVELEQALSNWRPSPSPRLQEHGGSDFLDRSDTRSFGETHSIQLSELDSSSTASPFSSHDHASLSAAQGRVVPPIPGHQDPFHDAHASSSSSSGGGAPPLPRRPSPQPSPTHALSPSSPPADFPINLSPTARPAAADLAAIGSPPHEVSIPLPPPGVDPSTGEGMAPPEPTVAETGAPKLGTGGPSSGQLRPRGNSLAKEKQKAEEQHGHDAIASAAVQGSGSSVMSHETYDPAGWGGSDAGVPMPGGFGHPLSQVPTVATSGSTVEGGEGGERLPGYGEGDDEAARARERAEQILADERERKAGGA